MKFLLAILLLLIAAPASAQQSQGMSQAMVVSSCGGGTLPSGALNQLTMDPQGRLCQSGIGSNVCSQATAYLARTTGGNEGGNAVAITALICGLVTDGVIDGTLAGTTTCGTHLDALYVLAQQNVADARLNLCGTSYSLTGTATFTAYRGFSGFTDPSLDTGFNPSSASSPHYIGSSANLGVWLYNAPDGKIPLGRIPLRPLRTFFQNLVITIFMLQLAALMLIPPPYRQRQRGCILADRSSTSTINNYYNGVSLTTNASAFVGFAANDIFIGSAGATGGWATTNTLSEAHIGGSLGATLNLALYNRLRTYMTAIGVP